MINFKDTHSHISMDPYGVYLSRIFLGFCPKPKYSTMVVEKFQSYSVKIIAIHLWVKKLNLFIFNQGPKQKSPPGFYRYPPGRRELPIPPKQRFLETFFFWRERGERMIELKELPKLTKVSVTSFNKFHHLCNHYIFGLCIVMQ